MKYVIEVDRSKLISKVSEQLMKIKEMNPPEWSKHAKTGTHKERPPAQADWWHMRAASILVKTAFKGPIGVAKLRTEYGGKKRRGHKPAEFRKASGSILRHIFQQLEKTELVKQTEKGVHKGRILTPKGTSLLNSVAKSIAGAKPKEVQKSKPRKTPAKETETIVEKPKAEKTSAEDTETIVEKPKAEKIPAEDTETIVEKPKAKNGSS